MIGTKIQQSARTLLYSVSCLCIAALVLWLGADLNKTDAQSKSQINTKTVSTTGTSSVGGGTMFPGTGVGNIPDGGPGCGPEGLPLNVTFNVTGLTGTVTNISLAMNATHSWVGDVNAKLIAPDMTEHVIFAGTNSTATNGCGNSGNLTGGYTFNDTGTPNWWGFSGLNIPTGTYQTTVAGDQPSPPAGNPTDFTAAFAGVAPNGTWTLRVTDGGGADTGAVSSAVLDLAGSAVVSGPTHVDFDGDGKTDYSQLRDTSGSLYGSVTRRPGSIREKMLLLAAEQPAESLTGTPTPGTSQIWYVNNSMSGTDTVKAFGNAIQDFAVPADYDGDSKTDIAIWRGVAPNGPGGGYFFVFRSSDSTVSTTDFGVQGDNPSVVGDYDGDGKADPAVFRCPATAGQCNFYYKGSAGAGITFIPWGFGTPATIFPSPGDFDGDGKYDFNIQRTHPTMAGQGQFVLFRSSDSGIEYIDWGTNTDNIIPGDFDGDGKDDINVGRIESGLWVWYRLFRAGGSAIGQFGLATDFLTPGDYDGDGKTDVSVFRPDADPNNNVFYVYRSSDGMVSGFEYGQNFDYPVANWQVN